MFTETENKNGRTLAQIAEELAPLWAEFMSHPDIPHSLHADLLNAFTSFEIRYSSDAFRLRQNFVALCKRAIVDPQGSDLRLLPPKPRQFTLKRKTAR